MICQHTNVGDVTFALVESKAVCMVHAVGSTGTRWRATRGMRHPMKHIMAHVTTATAEA